MATKVLPNLVITSVLKTTKPNERDTTTTKNTAIFSYEEIQQAIQRHLFLLQMSTKDLSTKKIEIITSFAQAVTTTTVENVNNSNYTKVAEKAAKTIISQLISEDEDLKNWEIIKQ